MPLRAVFLLAFRYLFLLMITFHILLPAFAHSNIQYQDWSLHVCKAIIVPNKYEDQAPNRVFSNKEH